MTRPRNFIPADFQRLRTGDGLMMTETTFNAFVDVAEAFRRGAMGKLDGDPLDHLYAGNVVIVQNNSGGDLAAFSVTGIDGPLFTDADNLNEFRYYPRFKVSTPSLPAHQGRWCVTIDPIGSGGCGRAVVSGVVAVQIQLAGTLQDNGYADVIAGVTAYARQGASGGAGILWLGQAGGGLAWAMVRLPAGGGGVATAPAIFLGQLAADLVAGSTPDPWAQVNVYNPDGSFASGGPFAAKNTFCESGGSGKLCLLVKNPLTADAQSYPYLLVRVVPQQVTAYQPGYDDNLGTLTYIPRTFYAGGASPPDTAVAYTAAQAAGSDLQRDDTSLSVSVDQASITHGQTVTITAAVSHAAGAGAPTGTVAFYWVPASGGAVLIATPVTLSSSATAVLATVMPRPIGAGTVQAHYSGDGNYNGSDASCPLTINKVAGTLAVTPSTSASTYGGTIRFVIEFTPPAPSASQGGSLLDPAGLVHLEQAGSNVAPLVVYRVSVNNVSPYGGHWDAIIDVNSLGAGAHTLTARYNSDLNYNDATATCTVTVNKATLNVRANGQTKTYGDANPYLDYTLDGFVLSDTRWAVSGSPALSTAAVPTSPPGSYDIAIAAGTLASANYAFNFINGTLSVSPARLTVTAMYATMPRGGPLPALAVTVSGAVAGDTFVASATTDATSASPPGSYTIRPAASGAHLSYYNVTYVQGVLTVT